MATSAGLQCEVDPVLCQALRVHKGECLIKLVVFIQLISPEGPYINQSGVIVKRTKVHLQYKVQEIPSV